MALKIRLRQQGRTNRQTYRLVVTDIRSPRDGKYIEMIGWYNPFNAANDCSVNLERMNYWIGQGAQLTPNASALIARIAPDAMKELRAKEQASRVKKVSKRRASRKKTASSAISSESTSSKKAQAPKKTVRKAAAK